jgi:small subunit ribosomal protein S16
MVRIRMKRLGRRRRPFYRINAIDIATKRDGKVLEQLGWYDPLAEDESKQVVLNEERVRHWLRHGAQPSESLMDLFAKRNLVDAEAWKAKRAARIERKMRVAAAKPTAPAAKPQGEGEAAKA